jgi:hypothetical protein
MKSTIKFLHFQTIPNFCLAVLRNINALQAKKIGKRLRLFSSTETTSSRKRAVICEEGSDEAIQDPQRFPDCFVAVRLLAGQEIYMKTAKKSTKKRYPLRERAGLG